MRYRRLKGKSMHTEKTAKAIEQYGINNRKQVKVSIDSSIAASFKKACAAENASMASTLSRFMADYANTAFEKRMPLPAYSTKRQRRTAIAKLARQLEQIRECEDEYRARIPENLQGSCAYDSAEEFISLVDEAIDALDSIASV